MEGGDERMLSMPWCFFLSDLQKEVCIVWVGIRSNDALFPGFQ